MSCEFSACRLGKSCAGSTLCRQYSVSATARVHKVSATARADKGEGQGLPDRCAEHHHHQSIDSDA